MKLTPNFSLSEFIRSDAAAAQGLDNYPPADVLARIQVLAFGMELVRRTLGGPIIVKSGYRSPEVNAAVKGTATSDHLSGWACDFVRPGLTPWQAAAGLRDAPGLTWDQMILEGSRGIVHISFDPQLRRLVQSQPHGPGTPLLAGLVV